MTARGDSSPPFSTSAPAGRATAGPVTVTTALIPTLALQSAVPPFATDMYTPAFPQITADLATSASLVGLTMTTFFLGMGAGQLFGGPLSDQRGRRMPMIVGGLICTVGAGGCALAPSIWLLIVFRVMQGFGGGLAVDEEMARLSALREQMVAMVEALPSQDCPPPLPGSWCPPDNEGR